MHFGENQLSRSLIGLSPLPTAHPPGFQPWWVRSSTTSYRRFNLAMGRSLRFGSRACDWTALFGLAFATAPPHGLTSPHTTNSQAHSSKGTPSQPIQVAPTVCKQTVSGTLSLPSRGTFHLSLTVLVRYRSSGSIQAYQVVLADSHGISRAPCYLGSLPRARRCFDYGTATLFGQPFKTVRLHHATYEYSSAELSEGPTTPTMQHLPALTHDRFSLFRFRSPLLTESLLFSLPAGTEMFHFPAFPLPALYIQAGVTRSHHWAGRGFPIRRPSDRSPLIGSPRIIADCYVLLRLQMPRHPPFALRNLTTHMSMNRARPHPSKSRNRT